MSIEAIYGHLPITLQHLACSAAGWRARRQRYTSSFWSMLQEAEIRTAVPSSVYSYRDRRLTQFIAQLSSHPFYQNLWQGISTDSIKTLSDLTSLPLINKDDARRDSRLLQRGTRKRITMAHTSGTTGAGLQFPATIASIQEQWATWWRYRRWHGIEIGTWCGYFGGQLVVPVAQNNAPYWRINWPGRQVLFSAYHMSEKTMRLYLDELNKRQPPWLHGYPSLLSLLATFMLGADRQLDYMPQWITTGAENLMPQQRQAIKQAFGVQPIQHYGQAEAVANISECPQQRLHIDEDFSATELILRNDGLYEVVGTNFSNEAFPLVRYRTGDIVRFGSNQSCPCERPGRVVEDIDGRAEDYVVLNDGSILGRLDHLFKDATTVAEAQIYQPRRGQIILRIVRTARYTPQQEDELRTRIFEYLGNRASLSFDYVEAVERTTSGKVKFVISDVADAELKQTGTSTRSNP